jgi:hypothetical protein
MMSHFAQSNVTNNMQPSKNNMKNPSKMYTPSASHRAIS